MIKKTGAFTVLIIILILSVLLSISVGSVRIPIDEIIRGIFSGVGGSVGIIRDIRIPRVILGVLVGANLSVSGVLLQSVMRNPLADPGITGISSGASVVVMVVLLYIPSASHLLPILGFAGSTITCIAIYTLAWKNGKFRYEPQ